MFLDVTFNSKIIEVFGMTGFKKDILGNWRNWSADSGLIQKDVPK